MKPPLPATDAEGIGRFLVCALKKINRVVPANQRITWESRMIDGHSVMCVVVLMNGGLSDLMDALEWAARKGEEFDDRA